MKRLIGCYAAASGLLTAVVIIRDTGGAFRTPRKKVQLLYSISVSPILYGTMVAEAVMPSRGFGRGFATKMLDLLDGVFLAIGHDVQDISQK